MTDQTDAPPNKLRHTVAGICSGITQAALLNPLDRALYISLTTRRPVVHPSNWTHPYQGLLQAISQRTLSGSLYYIFQDEMISLFGSIAPGKSRAR
jgi:hypothetical protein